MAFETQLGNARKIKLTGKANQGYQALFLVKEEHGLVPTQVIYPSQKYGTFGMEPVDAQQLGMFAATVDDFWQPFLPVPSKEEQVLLVFREMTDAIDGMFIVQKYLPWLTALMTDTQDSIDLSDPGSFRTLDSYTEVSDALFQFPFLGGDPGKISPGSESNYFSSHHFSFNRAIPRPQAKPNPRRNHVRSQ